MILQGTSNFPSLKVPWYIILLVKNCVIWVHLHLVFFLFTQLLTENIKSELRCMCRYTTKTSQGEEIGYFLEQIMLPHGQILDIIGLDTGSLHVRKLRISIYLFILLCLSSPLNFHLPYSLSMFCDLCNEVMILSGFL